MSAPTPESAPNDAELLERQRALQAEAREVLARTKLLDLLQQAGQPHLIGSFCHGLMVWRDLDIVILAQGLGGEQLAHVLAPLFGHPWMRRLHYYEENGPRSPSGDPGDQRHSVVLFLGPDDARLWKIDLSFWTAEGRRSELEHPARLAAGLTEETRLAILRLKHRWYRRPEYPDVVSGSDIYDAVLNQGIRTEPEFERYLNMPGRRVRSWQQTDHL